MRPFAWILTLWCLVCVAQAQPTTDEAPPRTAPLVPGADPPPGAGEAASAEGLAPDAATPLPPPAPEPPPSEPRGDTPISAEEIAGEAPPAAPAPAAPEPKKPAEAPTPPRGAEAPAAPAAPGPLVIWATAEWGNTLGPARCRAGALEGTEPALRVASALQSSIAVAGLGIATGGALGDHPLLAYAGEQQPEQLAALLASIGFSAFALGVSDLTGPLFRQPRLGAALAQRGVSVVASNLVCGGQKYCESWHTAEDPLLIVERNGRRYALLAVLPDDTLGRVQPVIGEQLTLQPALETMKRRLSEARRAGVDLVVAAIDHGPDATVAADLATFVAELPTDTRPDLLFSPSAGENVLFLRPLDVQPAIVGTRRDVLTGVRVTRIDERDTDVFARSVKLPAGSDAIAEQLSALGGAFCAARAAALPGGRLKQPLNAADFVALAGAAARQLAEADLALVDPRAFEPSLAFAADEQLQRAQVERAVPFDAPLMSADVTIEWLNGLRQKLEGLRPLTLIGVEQDRSDTLIAGRLAVPGARYRIVTSAVLVRSQRLPAGATFRPVKQPGATLRGALLELLASASDEDPRARLRDPLLGTQWVVRLDGQLLTNLTAVKDGSEYDDASLQADDSRQVGGRVVLNADADAPDYLFENLLQIAFDRNFVTRTTAQDLTFVQNTYTYRGLWPKPLFYPHPFVESYLETAFLTREDADYHHLMLRPRAGVRSMFTRVFSLKVAAGVECEVFDPQREPDPGLGGELLLKPWTVASSSGLLQLEGNVIYYWDSPGGRDEHMFRAQVISSYQLIGPLQATLSALAVVRKLPDADPGRGLTMQVGIRVRFVSRAMLD